MDYLTILTTRDLSRQELRGGSTVINSTDHPSSSLEPGLFPQLAAVPLVMGWDNTLVHLPHRNARFPPATLAHYFTARVLSDEGVYDCDTVVDAGCGTGFSGNAALINGRPRRVIFSDLDGKAIQNAVDSYHLNHDTALSDVPGDRTQSGLSFSTPAGIVDLRIGNVAHTLRGEHADAVVSCPFYLPRICEVFPGAYALFANLAKATGATAYFGHSNLAETLVDQAAESTDGKREVIGRQTIGFDVPCTDNRTGHPDEQSELEAFLTECGLRVDEEHPRGPYVHDLVVSRISYD